MKFILKGVVRLTEKASRNHAFEKLMGEEINVSGGSGSVEDFAYLFYKLRGSTDNIPEIIARTHARILEPADATANTR
jgi:hypothetical protein